MTMFQIFFIGYTVNIISFLIYFITIVVKTNDEDTVDYKRKINLIEKNKISIFSISTFIFPYSYVLALFLNISTLLHYLKNNEGHDSLDYVLYYSSKNKSIEGS